MIKPEIDEFDFWNQEYTIVSSKEQNEELDLEFKKAYYRYKAIGRITKVGRDELNEILRNYWLYVIIGLKQNLSSFILNKKTGNQPFRPFLKRIEDAEMKLVRDPSIGEYRYIYRDLKELSKDIEEMVAIEKAGKRWSRQQILIGFVLGIVASIIATVILIIFRVS